MNEQETIADIITAMREEGHTGEGSCLEWVGTKMRHYADRLEAAHRREVDKLNSVIQATVSRSDAEIDRLRREIAELKRAGNATCEERKQTKEENQ